jgi:hypothetical protein
VTAHFAWSKGGEGTFVSVADDDVVLRSSTPAPPGARVEGRLLPEPQAPIKVKSHGSKREADGWFTIRGRLLDAPRELRDRLAALVAAPLQEPPPREE